MSSRKLDDLSDRFRPLAERLIALATEAGIPLRIVETRRTEEEHRQNLARGVSWVSRSKHCDGDAIDLCPIILLGMKFWAPASPLWQKLGEIGEGIGLRWGGRWKVKDMCHFEYAETRDHEHAGNPGSN